MRRVFKCEKIDEKAQKLLEIESKSQDKLEEVPAVETRLRKKKTLSSQRNKRQRFACKETLLTIVKL